MKTRLLLAVLFFSQGSLQAAPPTHTFGWKGENFLLDGKLFVIRSKTWDASTTGNACGMSGRDCGVPCASVAILSWIGKCIA